MKPYYDNGERVIYLGDCIEVLTEMGENSVDSIVTDPPYELGFMGKGWDETGIANSVEMWGWCLRALKPGGYLLSFGGTRTYHRMACAIEDAGFEIRDMIEWVYGSGFPKSLNIGKAVDKLQGNERIVTGKKEGTYADIRRDKKTGIAELHGGIAVGKERIEVMNTKGTSEWEGWGTALKPAHEPICMARKPLQEKTVAENCLKWGTGGINIDESRVEGKPRTTHKDRNYTGNKSGEFLGEGLGGLETEMPSARFPANLIHDNSEEVRECFPEIKQPSFRNGDRVSNNNGLVPWNKGRETGREVKGAGFTDTGNASRFFKSIIYIAKASKSERGKDNNHPTVKPVALMEYLIKMVTPKGGVVLDPFMGSGSTGVASQGYNFIGIEKEKDYCEIAAHRLDAQPKSLF